MRNNPPLSSLSANAWGKYCNKRLHNTGLLFSFLLPWGQIVLNIAPRAVGNLELSNDEVRFNARFGGVPRQVSVPLAAVLAIYARENGAGTMFEPEAAYDEDVVSLNDDDNTAGAESETVMSVIDGDKPDHDDDSSPDDEPPPPRGGRPALRVVK